MNDNQPFFSIIIPVYNEGERLRKAIDSALNQTIHDIDVIVVDDGSTDRITLEILNVYKSDKRVNVIHKKNGGVSTARNIGLNSANGKYVIFLDGDDWLEADACECYRSIVENHHGLDVLLSNYVVEDEVNGTSEMIKHIPVQNYFVDDMESAICSIYSKSIFNILGCIRKELLDDCSIRVREDLVISEDLDFCLRTMMASKQIMATPIAKYHYCMHGKHGALTYKRFESQIVASTEWIDRLRHENYSENFRCHISKLFSNMACAYYLMIRGMSSDDKKKAYRLCYENFSILRCGSAKSKMIFWVSTVFGIRVTLNMVGALYNLRHKDEAS